MFFEGIEKKAELCIYPDTVHFIQDFDDAFWHRIVELCQAKILSKTQNNHSIAYLLSESSLFIWPHRVVIITCGTTQLVKAMIFLIQTIGINTIQNFFYQRKNEYFSHLQSSNFFQDVEYIQQYLSGNSYRMGHLDAHHLYLFHYCNTQAPHARTGPTYELLMHHIDSEIAPIFIKNKNNLEKINHYLSLNSRLKSWVLDEFIFSPCGYSMNAIKEDTYMTIHVTPENPSSYISVESNQNLVPYAKVLLDLFKPQSFDFIAFNDLDFKDIYHQFTHSYQAQTLIKATLCNGDEVDFYTFSSKNHYTMTAELLKIPGAKHDT